MNILQGMDPTYRFTYSQMARISTNCEIAGFNGLAFGPELIQALAEGDEKHPEMVEFRRTIPYHYDLLSKCLDEIYTQNQLQLPPVIAA